MKRREFIALLGGAAATWPLAARAQQGERMRRIGVLMNAEDDPVGQARLSAFVQTLQSLGWTAGRNVQIDIRWGVADAASSRRYAAEMVALAPDAILAAASAATAALHEATRTLPIVHPTGLFQRPGSDLASRITYSPQKSLRFMRRRL